MATSEYWDRWHEHPGAAGNLAVNNKKLGGSMDQREVLKKILQIEEHARDAIAEYPNLGVERLRMILAYARYLRGELTATSSGPLPQDVSGAAIGGKPPRSLN